MENKFLNNRLLLLGVQVGFLHKSCREILGFFVPCQLLPVCKVIVVVVRVRQGRFLQKQTFLNRFYPQRLLLFCIAFHKRCI